MKRPNLKALAAFLAVGMMTSIAESGMANIFANHVQGIHSAASPIVESALFLDFDSTNDLWYWTEAQGTASSRASSVQLLDGLCYWS